MNQYHKIQGLYKRHIEGKNKGKFIISEYSCPEFKLLKDIQWLWTEKIDGMNIRIQIYTCPIYPKIEFKGKTDNAQLPEMLKIKLRELFLAEKVFSIFKLNENKPDICLYGEGYGYKINNGCKYFSDKKEIGFILFDVKIGNTWLEREQVQEIGDKLLIKTVPVRGMGTIDESIKLVQSGMKSVYGNFIAEGLVIRPVYELFDRRGNRIITKIKYKDFYEKTI